MHDVADDGDGQGIEIAFDPADGEHVQHGLGGVGVAAVAGIDDADVGRHMVGDKVGGAAFGMAHHEHIAVHGLQVIEGVQQGFAFGGR